ncbi:Uncharacterised protein [Yersinia aldovae]|uniref:helix-turn-helix domain-containing protein n=1 Tax=Yersinia aldovae TaxID=29483 RepID=UPI0005E03EE4|nr:helix-turn-helix domain-containing protein [Yersinia aldovae]CNJ38889.1 Uncharacterised protein [Yersinia aldovae]
MKSLLDVAEQIKEIRQQKQFTQSDMRLINGMTQQQVSKFEKGGGYSPFYFSADIGRFRSGNAAAHPGTGAGYTFDYGGRTRGQ